MRALVIVILVFKTISLNGQINPDSQGLSKSPDFSFGVFAGGGWAYSDKAHVLNTSAGLTIDYHIKAQYFIQFAPKYSWLMKWNEHYLTLPLHLRRKMGSRISLFAGPALTYDIGHFRDLGLSFGACYQISGRSGIMLSAFTFDLYSEQIDYVYVPVSLTYHLTF